ELPVSGDEVRELGSWPSYLMLACSLGINTKISMHHVSVKYDHALICMRTPAQKQSRAHRS
ncbi:MAG TPA: hypothetical protein VHW72_21590, partial [Candidatus Angelobacter sp.]|nr:hypothetical protein [Candidatus Angelobacter sp.]